MPRRFQIDPRTDRPTPEELESGEDESDTDSDEQDAAIVGDTSLDDLVASADPGEFDRTFRVNKDDVPLAVGSDFPLPLPLQGIPRIAAVVNLNYVYDEEAGQWVKKKVSRETEDGTEVVGGTPGSFGLVIVRDQLDSAVTAPAVDSGLSADETNLSSSVTFT